MKIFQCANNACSGGAPMVFPQSALSVQDILNMQEANLLGTLPSGLLPCNSSCYGCPLSASNSCQNASSLFPLTGSCYTNGSSGAESNSSAAQQSCSPGIFPLSNSADNCPPASAVQTQATIQNTSSTDCTPCSSAMPLSIGIFPLMDSPTNCPPATTPAAPLGTVAAPPIVPAPVSRAAAPSLPVQNAAQFLVKTLASSNQPITAQPDVVRGEDISLEEEKIVFAPVLCIWSAISLMLSPRTAALQKSPQKLTTNCVRNFPVHSIFSQIRSNSIMLFCITCFCWIPRKTTLPLL